jgi:hypothetical protein
MHPKSVGLMNQAPTKDESNPYIKKKVRVMNQILTELTVFRLIIMK